MKDEVRRETLWASNRLEHTIAMNQRARLAADLVARWGMVAGIPDGEDSAGRAKLRLMTPYELAERAVSTAALLFTCFESEGWLSDIPAQQRDEERQATGGTDSDSGEAS